MSVTDNDTQDFSDELQAALNSHFVNREGDQDVGEESTTAAAPPPNPLDDTDIDADVEVEQEELSPEVQEFLTEHGENLDNGDADTRVDDVAQAPTQVDLNRLAEQFYGPGNFSEQQAIALFQVANDLSNLNDQQREELGRVLYGQQQSPAPTVATPTSSTATPAAYDYTPDVDFAALADEYPDLAPLLNRQHQEMQRISSMLDEQRQIDARQQVERYEAGVRAGAATWREAHPEIDTEDFTILYTRGGAASYANSLVQQGVPVENAMQQALDTALFASPETRAKTIEAEVQKREQALQANLSRKQRAAAVTGTGGPATRTAPSKPANADERRNNIRADIVSAMSESLTSPPSS